MVENLLLLLIEELSNELEVDLLNGVVTLRSSVVITVELGKFGEDGEVSEERSRFSMSC